MALGLVVPWTSTAACAWTNDILLRKLRVMFSRWLELMERGPSICEWFVLILNQIMDYRDTAVVIGTFALVCLSLHSLIVDCFLRSRPDSISSLIGHLREACLYHSSNTWKYINICMCRLIFLLIICSFLGEICMCHFPLPFLVQDHLLSLIIDQAIQHGQMDGKVFK
jgi:hypothetical protein